MKRFLFILVIIIASISLFFIFYKSRTKQDPRFMNIVLIGAAGSGKGTQAELMKSKFNLFQISAGEALRQYRQDPNAKYTKTINSLIDSGKLVPSEITNEIVQDYISKNVHQNKEHKYYGVIYDGYPREISQLEALDKYLGGINQKIDLVVYIKIDIKDLVDRLSGRFSCKKCGKIYHKKTNPTKIEGACDACGSHEFVVRADDSDTDAIKQRFKIFEEHTSSVLDNYKKRGIVFEVDGNKSPNDIFFEIEKHISAGLENVSK